MRFYGILFALTVAVSVAIASDTYTPAPLQLLTERINEHDQQICDLAARVTALERQQSTSEGVQSSVGDRGNANDAKETVVRVIVEQPAASTATRIPEVARVRTETTPSATRSSGTVSNATRLKSSSQLRAEIAAKRTNRTYATVSPQTAEWVTRHLVDGAEDHRYRYSRSQLAGLSYSELWMLHNLAHSPNRISPYASSSVVAKVETFDPTPRNPMPGPRINISPPSNGGCPNGRCPTARGASASSVWYPGKLIFGR